MAHAEKVVPFLLGTVGGFYGLMTGFMLSNSWAELKSLQNSIVAEVNALGDLGRIATNLPEPVAQELIDGVEAYLRTVSQGELDLLAVGRINPQTTAALENLWQILGKYHPETQWESGLRNLALNRVAEVGEQRRRRILNGQVSLPGIMWAILLCGGVVVVCGATLASLQYQRPAGLFLGALTAIFGLVLFVIFALDRPFRFGLTTRAHGYADLLMEMIRKAGQ
ncbi:MAG: DUF4239 domain-containing protein [Gammaproteobacteria bacterium]